MKVPHIHVCLLYIACLVGTCLADYACVCSYKDGVPIYADTDDTSTTLGKLNNWGCKQLLVIQVAHGWMPLAYEHQVGYVEKNSRILLQMCNGAPPVGDVLTMLVTNPTTASSQSTASLVTSPWTTTTSMTSSRSSPWPSSPPPTPQTTHTAVSSTAQSYTQYAGSGSTSRDGNIALCRPDLLSGRTKYHTVIGQFRRKCYVLAIDQPVSWGKAEGICVLTHGHLVHIQDQQEQDFVARFVKKYSPHQPIWLGLNDKAREGVWTWTSGRSSSYFNWFRHHVSTKNHDVDDCVILDPRHHGHWDDNTCGIYVEPLDLEIGEQHIIMCQYYINNQPPLIG